MLTSADYICLGLIVFVAFMVLWDLVAAVLDYRASLFTPDLDVEEFYDVD